MPTISCDRAALFRELGKEYTTKEFDELCFEYGIELDEDDGTDLKIEIPANRYDMLCFEGICLNLQVFLSQKELPRFAVKASGPTETLQVTPDTKKIRPFVAAAVLRGVKFTQERYDSFISLQDKLHVNLARQRTLVAIGTHDMSKIKGPFTYDALPPEQIKFIPLNQTKEMNAKEMMTFYEKDKHLGRYLKIIRDSPVYPVIYDSNKVVLSMPPIINGDKSKISLDTKDIFIECTATDKTKVEIVINMMVTMFSMYCSEPFTIEPVNIKSPHNSESRKSPNVSSRETKAEVSYINSCCGLSLSPQDICTRLKRMGYVATPDTANKDLLDVLVPPTRADVLHQADIMEDVAISYGFNNLPRTFPAKAAAIAAPLPLNRLADIVRLEAAMAGWSEVLPLILCSHDENFKWLNRPDDGSSAIRLQNPKTAEYQVVRTSLVPGLLKCIRENKHHAVPMRVFETSDVAFKDASKERKSRNERHFAAAWYGKTSGFEEVHGLLDRLMQMLKHALITREEGTDAAKELNGYWIEQVENPTFFPGRAASINVRVEGKKHAIGMFGALHPSVLKNFELVYPVSTLEFNLEVFL